MVLFARHKKQSEGKKKTKRNWREEQGKGQKTFLTEEENLTRIEVKL